MEEVFGVLGQAILAAVAAAGILGITLWFIFGNGTEPGPMGEYIVRVLSSVMGS